MEGRGAGVEGAGSGCRGGGERVYIKVHQGKHAYLCGLFCHTTHVMYGASRISA